MHEDQLEAAATLKQGGYSPLLRALDFYTKHGWVIHVFPWLVGIRGLLHPPLVFTLLQLLEVTHKHWPLAVIQSSLQSMLSTFHIVCGLVALLREVCVEVVLDMQNRRRNLQT